MRSCSGGACSGRQGRSTRFMQKGRLPAGFLKRGRLSLFPLRVWDQLFRSDLSPCLPPCSCPELSFQRSSRQPDGSSKPCKLVAAKGRLSCEAARCCDLCLNLPQGLVETVGNTRRTSLEVAGLQVKRGRSEFRAPVIAGNSEIRCGRRAVDVVLWTGLVTETVFISPE